MARHGNQDSAQTRSQILQAALHCFARNGYQGASIQEIVTAARVTKPALYYYYPSKAALYRALTDQAYDERDRMIAGALEGARTVVEKLRRVAGVVFQFSQDTRDLTRLCFSMAFAAEGEIPEGVGNIERGKQFFDSIAALVAEGQDNGELSREFPCEELAFNIYGTMITQVMVNALMPAYTLDDQKAGAAVDIFIKGAGARKAGRCSPRKTEHAPHIQRRPQKRHSTGTFSSPNHPSS
jgi:AcrR family transcriptional regulator